MIIVDKRAGDLSFYSTEAGRWYRMTLSGKAVATVFIVNIGGKMQAVEGDGLPYTQAPGDYRYVGPLTADDITITP